MANLFDLLVRAFCSHGLMKVIHSEYYTDEDLNIVQTDTYKCVDCDKCIVSRTVIERIAEIDTDLRFQLHEMN